MSLQISEIEVNLLVKDVKGLLKSIPHDKSNFIDIQFSRAITGRKLRSNSKDHTVVFEKKAKTWK